MELVVKVEKSLFKVNFMFASLFWVFAVFVGFKFIVFLLLTFAFTFVFAQSALIATLKGNAVKISAEQFPDLFDKLNKACEKLQMPVPAAYLMNGNGLLNAFATKFLNRSYILLYSGVVDSLEERNASIDFYIGHELGHLHRKHLLWRPFFMPLSLLPLLIPAYHRACESTCDQYGAFCCESPEDAARALSVLVAGNRRWKSMSTSGFTSQASETGGFWMSFHEITATYPWLSKRIARVQGEQSVQNIPKHSWAAWILGLFCPGFLRGAYLPLILIYAVIAIGAGAANFKKAQENAISSVEDSSEIESTETDIEDVDVQ